MTRHLLLLAVVAAAGACRRGAAAASAPYVPGEVIVKYKDGTAATVASASRTAPGPAAAPGARRLRAASDPDGDSVGETVRELRTRPERGLRRAQLHRARERPAIPNDPGFGLQWNLAGPNGINMPDAWEYCPRRAARPGGRGAVVAVLDTGVAYERYGRFRRAPDLSHFVRGYDFVRRRPPPQRPERPRHPRGRHDRPEHEQRHRRSGHRLPRQDHAGARARRRGEGDTIAIARGIRYAAAARSPSST